MSGSIVIGTEGQKREECSMEDARCGSKVCVRSLLPKPPRNWSGLKVKVVTAAMIELLLAIGTQLARRKWDYWEARWCFVATWQTMGIKVQDCRT